MLDVDHEPVAPRAGGPRRADGLVLVPYLEGERTPNLPDATGSLHGLTLPPRPRPDIARATVEGMLCGLADGLDAIVARGPARASCSSAAQPRRRPSARSRRGARRPGHVPPPGEYVADGAARQAAWALSGADAPPEWVREGTRRYASDPVPSVRERYAEGRSRHLDKTS